MQRVRTEAFRYGDPEFDADYLKWGFHDRETQIREAESVPRILRPGGPVRILDLACGIGTHAIHWARQGHRVTGVDLSETFIREARAAAGREGVEVEFLVQDIRDLDCEAEHELVTWIEKPVFHDGMAAAMWRFLVPGGCFVGDVRNPEHPRVKALAKNSRAWREDGGVFHLERHERDEKRGVLENEWITIDPERGIIEDKTSVADIRTCASRGLKTALEELPKAGFREVELRTTDGELFECGEEPYWLWVVARK